MLQAWPEFREVALAAFKPWTALCLAAEHEAGGEHSREAAAWIPYAIADYVWQNGDSITSDRVSEQLAEYMNDLLNTFCEDGSCDELATLLLDLHRMVISGRVADAQARVQRLGSAQLAQCQAGPEQSDEPEPADLELSDGEEDDMGT